MFGPLKRLMPRSLYGRAALILLLPVITIQLVVGVVFIQRFFEDVTDQMTRNQSVELRLVLDALAERPETAQAIAAPLGITLSDEPVADRRAWYDLTGRTVDRVLRAQVPGVVAVDLGEDQRTVRIAVDRADGPITLSFPRRRVSASNPHQLLVIMGFAGIVLTVISAIFLRNQLRPVSRMARAAEAFGRGAVTPYKPSGATEMRAAGQAFLDMRNRIERFTNQRTMMLSGVSHDLRTPLTRMRLALEMSDDPDAPELLGDVAEMERMIAAFLDYARSGEEGETAPVDAGELLAECAAKARRAGLTVDLVPPPEGVMVEMRREAVSRAIGNLLGNARRHGTHARASLTAGARSCVFGIEDDGPGIPEARREEAMRPFARLDAARNQDAGGGVGLGLAIAADIARRHGGQLRLGESDLGGLSAEIVLPR